MSRRAVRVVSMGMNALGAKAGLPSAAGAAASPGCRRAFMIARAGPAAIRKNATERPPLALSTRRRSRSTPLSPEEEFATSLMAGLSWSKGECLHDLQPICRRLFNGRADTHVGAAAAYVSCHSPVDIGVPGLAVARQP